MQGPGLDRADLPSVARNYNVLQMVKHTAPHFTLQTPLQTPLISSPVTDRREREREMFPLFA